VVAGFLVANADKKQTNKMLAGILKTLARTMRFASPCPFHLFHPYILMV
jgi:hypothetical protein